MKEIYDDMDKALNTNEKQKFDNIVKSIIEQLTFKKCLNRRELQLAEHHTWEINKYNLRGDLTHIEKESSKMVDSITKDAHKMSDPAEETFNIMPQTVEKVNQQIFKPTREVF
ncbi:unnamed protein product, partial [Meganyctiphanes norvegica]